MVDYTHILPLSENIEDRRNDPPMDPNEAAIRMFDPDAFGDNETIVDFEIEEQIKNPGALAKEAGADWLDVLFKAVQGTQEKPENKE